jgi:hypothetical protein
MIFAFNPPSLQVHTSISSSKRAAWDVAQTVKYCPYPPPVPIQILKLMFPSVEVRPIFRALVQRIGLMTMGPDE